VATTGIQKTLKPFVDKCLSMANSPQKTLKPFIDNGWIMANLIDVVAENHIQLLSLNN
jgi:hypothetical protein